MADEKKLVMEAMKKAAKPLRTGDIAKLTNLDSKSVSKIIKQLKQENLVVSPKRCYYELKQ